MPHSANHPAHDYAERLPRRLQDMREGIGLSMYWFWRKCICSWNIIYFR